AEAILDGCREQLKPGRRRPLDFVEDSAATQVHVRSLSRQLANGLEERMAGSDPFGSGRPLQLFLVEDDRPVLASKLAEANFERDADLQNRPRDAAEPEHRSRG